MGVYADALAAAENALLERSAGGMVDSYIANGVDVSLMPLKELPDFIKNLKILAAEEARTAAGGSRFHFASLRPGG